jgi:hypothetical protein
VRRLLAGLLLLTACRGSLSPLSNKLQVGKDPYVVFTADGEEGLGDLFASPLQGGAPYQITFTRVDERLPALSPDGSMLVFLRSRLPGDTGDVSLVIMNLLNGAERRAVLPQGIRPDATAWSPDGQRLFVRAGAVVLAAAAPPAEARFAEVSAVERPTADSALAVLLGDPPLATAIPCPTAGGVCVRLGADSLLVVAADAETPGRWPGDSVLYLLKGAWTVRPMGGGKTRVLQWSPAPPHIRQLTTFRGVNTRVP